MHAYKHSHTHTCIHRTQVLCACSLCASMSVEIHEMIWCPYMHDHWLVSSYMHVYIYINLSTCAHSFFSPCVCLLFFVCTPCQLAPLARELYAFQTLWLKHLDVVLFPIRLLSRILCIVNSKTFTQPAHLKPTRRLLLKTYYMYCYLVLANRPFLPTCSFKTVSVDCCGVC